MEKLTPRQAEILSFIRDRSVVDGRPPTRAEISREFGFRSVNSADAHLRALARKGAIALEQGTARGIRVQQREKSGGGTLPLIGRVAAGSPLLAQEHVEDYYEVDARLFRPRAHYLLRVHGDSMSGAGILDGDLVAVHSVREARDGQVVIARVGDEVTVKRLYRAGTTARLVPENPAYAPIELDLRTVSLHIEGLAVGVLRNAVV